MFENNAKKVLKLFVVNANVCDATRLREENLQGYDMIVINAATLVTSPATRAILARYPVSMNVANQVELDVDTAVEVATINGRGEIHPGMAVPQRPTFLTVNGRLEIAPGSEEIVRQYCGMVVNGNILCPESISALLSGAMVNGRIETYPDDCILLPSTAVLDRTFVLRAKQGARYYAARRMVALDLTADHSRLAEKQVQLVTPMLLLADSLAETVLPCLDDKARVELLPDGCAFVDGDAVLNEGLLRRYGTRLYVNGDLTVNSESAPWLERVEYLSINGDARVVRSLMEPFRRLDARYGSLCPTAGTVLTDRVSVRVDAALLENAADGLQLEDCVNVKFAAGISPALLQEKLVAVKDCVNISCTAEQRPFIEAVASDVVNFSEKGGAEEETTAAEQEHSSTGGFAGQLRSMLGQMGIDLTGVDLFRSVLGSRLVNGNVCRL